MKLSNRSVDLYTKKPELTRKLAGDKLREFFDFDRDERVWATCSEVCELIGYDPTHSNATVIGFALKTIGCIGRKTMNVRSLYIPAYKKKLPGQSKAECIVEGYEEANKADEEKTESTSGWNESEFFEG